MNLKDLVAITGVAGLNKMVANRSNGLVAENLDTGKTKFYPIRKHQFTPLETVAIYTDTDTAELKQVLQSMMDKKDERPVPENTISGTDAMDYFEIILPEYDKDRVFASDVKKIIKWYHILDEKGYLEMESNESDSPSTEKTE